MAYGDGKEKTFGGWRMSSDLVKRLRYWAGFGYGVEASATMNAAAVRIEQLEAALRDIADGLGECDLGAIGRYAPVVARAALGENKDD